MAIDEALDNLASIKNGEDPRDEEETEDAVVEGREYADEGGMSGDPCCPRCCSFTAQFDIEEETAEIFVVGCGVCGHRDPEAGHMYTP